MAYELERGISRRSRSHIFPTPCCRNGSAAICVRLKLSVRLLSDALRQGSHNRLDAVSVPLGFVSIRNQAAALRQNIRGLPPDSIRGLWLRAGRKHSLASLDFLVLLRRSSRA
jgi:hypothetical protein